MSSAMPNSKLTWQLDVKKGVKSFTLYASWLSWCATSMIACCSCCVEVGKVNSAMPWMTCGKFS